MTEFDDATPMGGSATAASGDDESECPLATLWLPDPDATRGWSMRHVWKKDEKKAERPMGFKRK